MTTHAEIMRVRRNPDPDDPNPRCTAELIPDGGGFWDDVRWGCYVCPVCNIRIAAVEGGAHWWNYVRKPKEETR